MAFHYPWHYLLNPRERLFWGYLLTSAVLALLLTIIQQRRLPSRAALKNWLTDKDTRLDVAYFFVNWLLKIVVVAPLILSAQVIAVASRQLTSYFFEPIYRPIPYVYLVAAYSVTLFVFSDFTRYWLHRWLHRSRILWAFHKVHHSPETLNPLSFYRVHPVENLLFGLRYSVSAGVVTGIFMALFGGRFQLYTIFGVNAFIVVFSALGANLRHSPVRLTYGRFLEHLFISPAQHQIHHSTRHMNHNYGGYLAIWDWMFGSLKCSHEADPAQPLGLGRGQHEKYNRVYKLLLNPFLECGRIIRRGFKKG